MGEPFRKGPILALNGLSKASPNKRRLRRIAVVICGLIVAGYVLYPLLAPLEKADLVGYSICHRIPARSFHLEGRQLPLCARCTGTYLGIVIGFAALAVLRRWRAGEMLRTGWVVLMVCFIGIMGVDGLNSYLSLFPNMPHLYEPQNWLRALTGSLNGIALTMIVWPVFNFTLWKRPQAARPLQNGWELGAILLVALGTVAVVQAEPAWLLYPMALLSAGGVLWMLALVNAMILLIVFRHDSQAETWRDAVPPLLGGLTAALLELTAMGTLRYLLTGTMSWPLA
jgi:uncharacterized membrane protein